MRNKRKKKRLKKKKIQEIIVTSAHKLDEEVVKAIASRYGGKDKKLKFIVDQKLLGGLMINTGEKLIDLSVKTKLEDLKQVLHHKF
jgi:F0F1-type ATP synthase delta subunit